MASAIGKEGTFQAPQEPQAQQKPGEATKLESSGTFVEYVGSGKLKDKKVLITGGDSGIGRSVAALMAREGADVTISYLPEEQEDAEETKKLVEAENRTCLLFPGDLSNRETCRQAVEEHMKKFKKLNVLVNNASKQYMCKDLAQIDLDQVEHVFQTNIIQMFALSKFALPHLSRGDSGTSGMVDYAATKGAIVGFTRSLAKQLMPKGIRVNAVAPGPVYTPIQVDTRAPEEMEDFGAGSSIGRPGQPSEVATSFVFLASSDASLYYGQILHCYPLGD
ncbi:unnamed protein product [Aspergillus oryzae RIB40]|uniref:DNA, SC113 n=1 Tax=Aspergillus oryzae (strain ATCC 42149 / RIB 40) TaxID=510516 RepID=Q2U6I4_ASPOR|nr:unnamed protein product [Aspergillus oryzae RIB40]BAE62831.1 unnamed protein product [Aspergillus oryzae RIB40]